MAGITKAGPAIGVGWKAFNESPRCASVGRPACCMPVAVVVANVSEWIQQAPAYNTPEVLPYYPAYTSQYTLFSWKAEAVGELIYQPGFEEFWLLAFGTPARTEVLRMTGYVQSRDSNGRLEKRTVPNQPVKPREPFNLSIRHPADPGASTNLLFRGAEVESADEWLPTYRGSQLSGATPLRETFLVTPSLMRESVKAGSLTRSFEWREGFGEESGLDNQLNLEFRFGEYEERRNEVFKDPYCPDQYSGTAAYERKQDLSNGTLTIVVRIRLQRRSVVRSHFVDTFRGPTGEVELYVSDVTTGGKTPEKIAVSMPTLKKLQEQWEQEIEGKWNDRFEIDCGCLEKPLKVVFDVRFVDHGGHHVIAVLPGAGRSAADTWYEVEESGVAAHEFGHLLGLNDEYKESHCPRRPGRNDNSIMDDYSRGVPKKRHFEQFARWLSQRGGRECTVRAVAGTS